MALAIIQLLAAMFRAFPKFTELVECAIDKGVGNDCEGD